MRLFLNLRIRRKLLITFAMMALIILVQGAFSITTLDEVNDNAEEMYEEEMAQIMLLDDIEGNLNTGIVSLQKIIWEYPTTKDRATEYCL